MSKDKKNHAIEVMMNVKSGILDLVTEEFNPDSAKTKINMLVSRLIVNYLRLNLSEDGISLKNLFKEIEKTLLVNTLILCNGNKSKASSLLKLNQTTLIEKLKKYQITYKKNDLSDFQWQSLDVPFIPIQPNK